MERKEGISRRGFLKTAAAVGAALTIQPTMNKVQAANVAVNGDDNRSMQKVTVFRIVHWIAEMPRLKCQLSGSGLWV